MKGDQIPIFAAWSFNECSISIPYCIICTFEHHLGDVWSPIALNFHKTLWGKELQTWRMGPYNWKVSLVSKVSSWMGQMESCGCRCLPSQVLGDGVDVIGSYADGGLMAGLYQACLIPGNPGAPKRSSNPVECLRGNPVLNIPTPDQESITTNWTRSMDQMLYIALPFWNDAPQCQRDIEILYVIL